MTEDAPSPTSARRTPQREVIWKTITHAKRPLSPQEILDRAQRELPSISLATVYRALKALADEGAIIAVELPGESARYERADIGHHHHFHCRACGRAFDLPGCPVKLRDFVPPGFVAESHDLTVQGLCPDCSSAG